MPTEGAIDAFLQKHIVTFGAAGWSDSQIQDGLKNPRVPHGIHSISWICSWICVLVAKDESFWMPIFGPRHEAACLCRKQRGRRCVDPEQCSRYANNVTESEGNETLQNEFHAIVQGSETHA